MLRRQSTGRAVIQRQGVLAMMESKFITTPSGKIHAQIAGQGNAILLIHGYSPQFNSWRTWQKNIDALAERHRVYALDLLGYGESDKPATAPDASREAKALIELLQVEKIARTILIGLSWGGGIAQKIAAESPELVAKLVLVDSASDSASLREVSKRKIPTLITWDEDDTVIPVEHAHTLARMLAHAHLRILTRAERDPDANPENRHWSQETHSRVWNRVVTDFLKE
jgi:pimeloyl-ACP methyl ester carboxylesterase